MQSGTASLRDVLARVGRMIVRYQIPLAVAAIVALAAYQLKRVLDASEAYRNSPEVKVEAQREAQAAEDDAFTDIAKTFVQSRLRDPQSAQFTGVRVARQGTVKGVCGYVNSRNGFGGMAGNEAFAVIDMQVIMANDAFPKDQKRFRQLCYGQ